jgi:hypothetical protein
MQCTVDANRVLTRYNLSGLSRCYIKFPLGITQSSAGRIVIGFHATGRKSTTIGYKVACGIACPTGDRIAAVPGPIAGVDPMAGTLVPYLLEEFT